MATEAIDQMLVQCGFPQPAQKVVRAVEFRHQVEQVALRLVIKSGDAGHGFGIGPAVGDVAADHEALELLQDHQPQIILLDVEMPGMDGYKFLRMVASREELADIPVIMLSSKDGLFDRARGRIVGSEQYLTKPFTKDELLGAIRRYAVKAA